MRKQSHWCERYIYLDAFAGGGKAPLRKYEEVEKSQNFLDELSGYIREEEAESELYVNGSPRVALSIQHPFTDYIFVEKNSDRIRSLKALQTEFHVGDRVSIMQGDANQTIKDSVLALGKFNWKKTRGVAFLDPFGMQVPWETLEALGQTAAFEIILNLPVGMAIQRLLPRSGEFTEEKRSWLNEYFGSPDWYNIVYEQQQSLFGMETSKKADSGAKLALWYQERLKAAFGYASRPRLIRNTRGSHLYFLLWAGPHKVGAKIADDVLKQGEPI